jgi:hypothetical protein
VRNSATLTEVARTNEARDELGDEDTAGRVQCVECGRRARDVDDEEERFRFWSDGVGELMAFCVECSHREFGVPRLPDARSQGGMP